MVLFLYVSQFSEEKIGLEICSLVLELLNKQTFLPFFLKHPVVKSFYDARRHLYPKLLVKQMAEDRYHQDKAFNRLKSFDNKHNKRSIFKNNDFVHLGVHPVGLSSGFVYLFSGKCSFSTSFFSAKSDLFMQSDTLVLSAFLVISTLLEQSVVSIAVGWCSGGWLATTIVAPTGRQILWEPGNQVPTKCLSWSEFFDRIHAFSRIDRISLTKGYELTRNNSCDKNWFLFTRINFLWQNWFLETKLISWEKSWFLVTRIDFLWQYLISCHEN